MKKPLMIISAACLSIMLGACGGGSSSNNNQTDETTAETITYGPLSTGSVAAPSFVYFDLETMSQVALTEAEAQTNTQWDVAFKRSGVYLNNANSASAVSAYFTGNNAEFFDANGAAISDAFINATPDTELADFTNVTAANIPLDTTMFVADETNNILDSFYHYNFTTHSVTAADTHYFILSSDDTFSKIRVTDITTLGRDIASLTVNYANQTASDTAFSTAESSVVIDTASACAGFQAVYVDLAIGQVVAEGDDWDLHMPCNADNTAAGFEMNIPSDAQAMQDFDNAYAAIDPAAIHYYGFQSNQYTIKAFDANPWYQYGVNGGHTLWSQYGVYLIKTETATYKFQMTSYYNELNESGNISFRAEAL